MRKKGGMGKDGNRVSIKMQYSCIELMNVKTFPKWETLNKWKF